MSQAKRKAKETTTVHFNIPKDEWRRVRGAAVTAGIRTETFICQLLKLGMAAIAETKPKM